MKKLQVDDFGVYKNNFGEFFAGITSENEKLVKNPLTEQVYSINDLTFLGLLSNYYPRPIFDIIKDIEIIGSKKVNHVQYRCLNDSLISKEQLNAFQRKLTRFCKKEEKLIKSGALVKTSVLSDNRTHSNSIKHDGLEF